MSQFNGVRDIFGRYWSAYGGWKCVFGSPYFLVACFLMPITFGLWSKTLWWESPISVIPNLLGFTLGGFAMFLGFGDEKFRELLADPDENELGEFVAVPSLYLSVSATFVHFIVIQVLSLITALIAKSLDFHFNWPDSIAYLIPYGNLFFAALSFLIFIYALTSIMAATMQLFRVASWYEAHRRSQRPANDPQMNEDI